MMRSNRMYHLAILLTMTLSFVFSTGVWAASSKQFNALLFTKTAGHHHKSIPVAVDAMERLANQHHFNLAWHQDARKFTPKFLSKFDVVIFLNTSGDVLNEKEQLALKEFVESGKGFVAIHGALASEANWPWFGKLLGHRMRIHPPLQTARIMPINLKFPGMGLFPSTLWWTDEWYELTIEGIKDIHYLLKVDESTYKPKAKWKSRNLEGKGMGEFHPLSWCHRIGNAHIFATSLGHSAQAYNSDMFLQHLYGGIYWAAKAGDISSVDALCGQ